MNLIRVQAETIAVERVLDAVRDRASGAVAAFVGTVRDENRGRRVRYLEYHAYPEMAEKEMSALAERAVERFAISRAALVHRIGRLEIGEVAVVVAVSAEHRAAALEACGWLIETLKRTVPIWKKEFFEGGEVWVESSGK